MSIEVMTSDVFFSSSYFIIINMQLNEPIFLHSQSLYGNTTNDRLEKQQKKNLKKKHKFRELVTIAFNNYLHV